MAAHDEPTHDGGLTPEQEAEVRRLLADARHTEPTPEAVVARLDRVMADLAGEPARSADVVRLADRRRKAATILVAAAASVAAVIGVGQLVSNPGSGGADSMTAGEAADSDAEAPAAESEAGGSRAQSDGSGPEELAGRRARQRRPYLLQSEEFARDADALQFKALDSAVNDRDTDGASPEGFAAYSLSRVRGRTVCEPGSWGRGGYVAVLYDGAEGWIVLRQPQGETQVADLFLCGSEAVVRSVTLPYP